MCYTLEENLSSFAHVPRLCGRLTLTVAEETVIWWGNFKVAQHAGCSMGILTGFSQMDSENQEYKVDVKSLQFHQRETKESIAEKITIKNKPRILYQDSF